MKRNYDRINISLKGHRNIEHVFVIIQAAQRRFSDEEGMHLAAGIAYYTLLSIFPAALLFVSLSSFFFESEAILNWMIERFSAETPVSVDFLRHTVTGAVAIRGPAGVFGLVGLILSSTVACAAIMRSINRAWGLIGTGTRRFLRRKLWEFAILTLVSFLFLLSYLVTNFLHLLRSTLFPGTVLEFLSDTALSRFIFDVLPFLFIMTCILLLLYKYVPTTRVRWHDVWLPSILCAFALKIANDGLRFYVRTYAYYDAVYGSLTGIIVLLLWLYVSANILIFGAVLSAVLASHRKHK